MCIEEKYINIIKAIYDKPTAILILFLFLAANWHLLFLSPLIEPIWFCISGDPAHEGSTVMTRLPPQSSTYLYDRIGG